ncbi:MAG: TRAP transporter large permease [Rubrivivax sp.]|nr:TRAP transporter large permease [Rubrivivax sp.]
MALGFGLFLFLLLFGAPIVFALGVSSLVILTMVMDVPVAIVAQRLYAGLDSFTIMAIPFFVIAGLIMDAGGISRRIVALADALVGWITGSLLLLSVMAATGMGAISGSGSADTAAISSIMQPEIRRRGYDRDFAAAIIAAGGSLAAIIPPSLLMVVIASISNISVGALFLAGIVPGLIASAGLLGISYLYARRAGPQYRVTTPFDRGTLVRTFVNAIPAMGLPVIIVGGIIGGIFTPTEAAAVAVLYGLVVGIFLHRELKWRVLPRIILRAAAISASVMIILASASIFSWLVSNARVADSVGTLLREFSSNPATYLLIVNVLLLVVGMFMESIAAMLILVPVLMPLAMKYGVDPVHFALIVVFNLTIGFITPPYGIALYVAATVAERSILQVARKVWQPLLVMISTLLLITYVPSVGMWLPNLVLRQ